MFCQLFGKFLIEKEIIDRDKYKSIMERLAESRAKLGVIAVADGIITEKQANEINHLQTTKDARFGEIAVGEGYMTEEQLDALLKSREVPMQYSFLFFQKQQIYRYRRLMSFLRNSRRSMVLLMRIWMVLRMMI